MLGIHVCVTVHLFTVHLCGYLIFCVVLYFILRLIFFTTMGGRKPGPVDGDDVSVLCNTVWPFGPGFYSLR